MKNTWTAEQQKQLDEIEAKLIGAGVPEHQARLRAEQELEERMERKERAQELHA